MRPVTIIKHPNGPRLYVASLRVHHGLTGAACVALGAARRRRSLFLAGWLLMLHDAHDFRLWMKVEKCPVSPQVIVTAGADFDD